MLKKKYRRKTKLFGTVNKPRLVVFRSLKHIYGQIIDDTAKKTILGASDLSVDLKQDMKKAKTKVERSKLLGELIARKAKDKKINQIIFDRNGYKYHGRIKALAEGLRQGGLDF